MLIKLFSAFTWLADASRKRVESYGAKYQAFGIFSTVNYLIPVYMWSWHGDVVSPVIIRTVAVILSFLLVISDAWWEIFKPYLPLFWHFTIMFCLPFQVAFMIYVDGLNSFWITNANIAILSGLILLDFRSFLTIYSIGIVLGLSIAYMVGFSFSNFKIPEYLSYESIYMLAFTLVIVGIFSHNLRESYDLQMKSMRALAGYVAHEIHTPLATIILTLDSLKSEAHAGKISLVCKKANTIKKQIKYIFDIVNVILINLSFNTHRFVSMGETDAEQVVSHTIESYQLFENYQNLIQVKVVSNFKCLANKELLMAVLFNLLQNAIYQIKAAGKGKISIIIEEHLKWNVIIVRDTATGIEPSQFSKIFNPFITTKGEHMGLGLHFCRKAMRSMNGEIYCESVHYEYAQFTLQFPPHFEKPRSEF